MPLDLVIPAEWGAEVDYDSKAWRPWKPDKWVIHYGGLEVRGHNDGVEREKAVLRAWERYHKHSKGWLGIAYNYAIGNSGTIYRLRGENRSGATSGDYEHDGIPENHEARAVVFILGGGQKPSQEALDAFQELYYTLGPMPVIGHKDVKGGTACPGAWLTAYIRREDYIMEQQFTDEEAAILKDFARGIQDFESNGYGFAEAVVEMIRGLRDLFRRIV